jgi:hypothetical protein
VSYAYLMQRCELPTKGRYAIPAVKPVRPSALCTCGHVATMHVGIVGETPFTCTVKDGRNACKCLGWKRDGDKSAPHPLEAMMEEA